MPRTFLDHIAITAFSLEAGAALVADTLGVETQRGGEHPRMATHNRLLRLGKSMYLEVIAPNPAARSPGRPRWFGLDTLAPHALPALSAWVVRSTDIQASAAAASEPLGDLEPMRRSALDWLITIPADGSVPLEGAAPALIQWHADAHPAARMEDKGCALALLEIFHPDPERISRLLSSLELEAPVAVRQAGPGDPVRLAAHIDTPHGRRIL
ncbi:VOC family protein [Castellaniella denitrificans]|uniref:VOC family protein n=1 Tax=Castellaniella denitrificans TaxID=56119 RepID=A0ABT4M3Z9_9BURK|nr:VOC family protein [Castellaniella denitrificans]MCZ4330047.1 VOC family protein [Castellaniella denitrificans]